MLAGLVLKHVLRCPLKLLFTSVALRRHSWLPRLLMRGMDAIIATTESAGSLAPRCDAIVPHGVDTSAFLPPADKQRAWRETGLPGKYGIGIFGRVRAEKGTDLFVEAMCRVLPRHPDFTAVIAGRWKDGDREFQQRLADRIAAAGLTERVVWLGEVPAAVRDVWFQRISLCVAPARYEGFGLTPIEAMACGAAAVATRTGVYPHLIEDGVTGYVVEIGDVEALATRIEQCLADPEELLAMGRRGREHVVRHYDIQGEAAGIEQVYERIFKGEL
jgi:mannosyltransferase